jgi:DNA polymerase III chi subunit, HolC
MTSIDFYFNAEDRLRVACRLAGKALKQNQRLLIYAPDANLASQVDKMLWTWPAIGFVPHCAVLERLGPEVDRVIEERLARTLNTVLGQALEGVRAEITVSVTQMVREAVAASVAFALRPKTSE